MGPIWFSQNFRATARSSLISSINELTETDDGVVVVEDADDIRAGLHLAVDLHQRVRALNKQRVGPEDVV
jgi:hypothetical protein